MKQRKHRESLIAEGEVDLTPLIDCVFLLLIFFMVTTVFIDVQGLVVDLPSAAEAQDEQQQQKKDVNVLISSTGGYTVAGTSVSSSGLAAAIKGAMDIANNRNIIIQGDKEASHKSVIFAMDMATSVGAEMLAFAIEQQESQ
jgi:biopolymer transport protein ExbD